MTFNLKTEFEDAYWKSVALDFNRKLGQISNYSSKSIFICLRVRDVRNHLFHWLLNG